MESFVRHVSSLGSLNADDTSILLSLTVSSRRIAAGHALRRDSARPSCVHLLQSGFAYRSRETKPGQRQIVCHLLPGDFCDLDSFLINEMDFDVAAITDCVFGEVPLAVVDRMMARPAIVMALWRSSLTRAAILQEWVVNLGSLKTEEKIAYFFCEMFVRLRAVGMASNNECHLPLTQTHVADTLGISLVHTNKCMRSLRERGLALFRGSKLIIDDFEKLAAFCAFRKANFYRPECKV